MKKQLDKSDITHAWFLLRNKSFDSLCTFGDDYAIKLLEDHEYLIGEVARKDKELKELQASYQVTNADYKALTDIMDRARRLAYLSAEKEEEERPRFRMDDNGNLTRIEDGE